jgi:hypothetical protein
VQGEAQQSAAPSPAVDPPARNAPVPIPNPPADERYEALYRLWRVFLYMATWGTPDHEEIGSDSERASFREAVETKELFGVVQDFKTAALRARVKLSDDCLGILSASRIEPGAPLPKADRDELLRVLRAVAPMLMRLDPDADPAPACANADSAEPSSLPPDTTETGCAPRIPPTPDAPAETPSISDGALAILLALARNDPVRHTQENLADITTTSLPTIRKRLTELWDAGFVAQPSGSRAGYVLTHAGRQFVSTWRVDPPSQPSA